MTRNIRVDFHSQGTLDGMCGQYALINAFTACGALKTYVAQQAMLKTLNAALPKNGWPAAVTAGTSFDDLRMMIRRAQRARRVHGFKITYPFDAEYRPKRLEGEYLDQLLNLLPTAGNGCAIIAVQRPDDGWVDHWIVVRRRGDAFQFIDSVKQRGRTTIMKKQSGLRVGRHHGNDTRWRISARRQVIVFRKS
jgi:hypothetical protein